MSRRSSAFTGYSGLSVYAATKASMVGFTRSLAREVGRMGVNVNAVAPGFLDTEMTRGLLTSERAGRSSRRSALKRLPRSRTWPMPSSSCSATPPRASPARCSPSTPAAPHKTEPLNFRSFVGASISACRESQATHCSTGAQPAIRDRHPRRGAGYAARGSAQAGQRRPPKIGLRRGLCFAVPTRSRLAKWARPRRRGGTHSMTKTSCLGCDTGVIGL